MHPYLRYLVIIALLFTAKMAVAGGPFVVDTVNDSGTAQQWVDDKLIYYTDDGDLSATVDNETAREWIAEAINKWTGASLKNKNGVSVNTTGVTAQWGGNIGVDIDENNYDEYDDPEPGPTVIIFDKDAGIIKDMWPGAEFIMPGVTGLTLSSSDGKEILRGVVILNGVMLSGGEIILSNDQFKAAILHELGHLFNMDHTQVNFDIADVCDLSTTCDEGQYIPTMYPELKTAMQRIPSIDDLITISWLYPNSTFENYFCTITGEIQDRDGNPLQGVNVIARRVLEGDMFTKGDARSMVSGVLYPACAGDGHYYLHGIIPGKTYEVFYEPLTDQYRNMSGFEPLANPPTGFTTETIPAADGSTTVSCEDGGETIQMQTVQVDVSNPCVVTKKTTEEEGEEGTSGGGCSLILPK